MAEYSNDAQSAPALVKPAKTQRRFESKYINGPPESPWHVSMIQIIFVHRSYLFFAPQPHPERNALSSIEILSICM